MSSPGKSWCLFLLVTVSFGSGCGDQTPKWVWVPCTLEAYGEKVSAECITLEVPLRWNEPEGPKIDLFVRRLRGQVPDGENAIGQLWLLQGGPGASGLGYVPLMKALTDAAPLDVYVPDHRGTGGSTRLGCSEFEREDGSGGTRVTLYELDGCLTSALGRWGKDLAEFSTTAAARDVAFAIERLDEIGRDVFVYGSSYGTYWANRYLQLSPEQATAAILDSVAAPTHSFLTVSQDYHEVGEALLDFCARDDGCRSKLGSHPLTKLSDLLEGISRGNHCSALQDQLDWDLALVLKWWLKELLAIWPLRPFVPAVIYRLDRCATADVRALVHLDDFLTRLAAPRDEERLDSDLLYWNVSFSELWGTSPPSAEELARIEAASLFHPGFASVWRSKYNQWPRYPQDEHYGRWARTWIPLLIMQGGLDPQTPIGMAAAARDQYVEEHQHFVEFLNSPHGIVSQSPMSATGDAAYEYANQCGFHVLLSFLEDHFSPPDTSCIEQMRPIEFIDRLSLSERLLNTGDLWGDQATRRGQVGSGSQRALETRLRRPVDPTPIPRPR